MLSCLPHDISLPHSADNKIPRLYRTRRFIVMNTVHILIPYFNKIYFTSNILHTSIQKTSKWLSFYNFWINFRCRHISQLSHAFYVISPSQLIDLITLIIFFYVEKFWCPSLCSSLQSSTNSTPQVPVFSAGGNSYFKVMHDARSSKKYNNALKIARLMCKTNWLT